MYDFFFVRAIQNNQTKVKILDFLNNQNIWMRQQIEEHSDPIWRHVGYIVSQYDGLISGYNAAAVDMKVIYFINIVLAVYASSVLS